jgi:uncharacterized protein YbbC (DUF1343 family)
MMDIRRIGLETFIPCDFESNIRFDMNVSNNKWSNFQVQKYAKLLCLETFLLFILFSCKVEASVFAPTIGSIVIEEDTLRALPVQMYSTLDLKKPLLGIDRLHLFVDSLKDKRIAVVGNQTSVVKGIHLVDTLLALKLNVIKVFSPEHGFRGDVDAGEKVHSSVDEKTGIPLVSLYGNHKKPTDADLSDIDIVIYDIQDVGIRFYTYISTLHYVMEACAENNKQLVVLDRPNPNGHYVDGPVLEPAYKSFIGMHPVPIVYGMTIGEYALMVNGELWLDRKNTCNLWVIPCKNYTHKTKYVVTVPPSPNLKSELAISLYPSLCFFEATTVSVGRGTEKPFEMYGHPRFPKTIYQFTPVPQIGARNPPHVNKVCNGYDLSGSLVKRTYEINLNYLTQARDLLSDSAVFIDQNAFFNRLAGTATLMEQLYKGWSAKEIRATWQPGIDSFMLIRKKYLLYD